MGRKRETEIGGERESKTERGKEEEIDMQGRGSILSNVSKTL